MNKTLLKDIFREIYLNKSRFFSIMALLFISIVAFSGVYMATILLEETPEENYNNTNLQDFTITSTLGLSDRDEYLIGSNTNVEDFEMSKFIDVVDSNTSEIVRLETLPEKITTPILIEGELPKNSDEIALSYLYYKDSHKIGEEIEFFDSENSTDIENLTRNKFTITGFVNSTEYLTEDIREVSTMGSGTVSSFGYILENSFDMDYYTKARIKGVGLTNLNSFSDEYSDKSEEIRLSLEDSFEDRPRGRIDEIREDSLKEIEEAEQELIDARQELEDARIELQDGKSELDDAKLELMEADVDIREGEIELQKARRDLNDGWNSYNQGIRDLEAEERDQRAEIANARQELNNAKTQLDEGFAQLEEGRAQLEEAKLEIESGEAELLEGERIYQENLAEYNKNRAELDENIALLENFESLQAQNIDIENLAIQTRQLETQLNSKEIEVSNIKNQIEEITIRLNENPDDIEIQENLAELENNLAIEEEILENIRIQIAENNSILEQLSNFESSNMTPQQIEQLKYQVQEGEEMLSSAKAQLDEAKAQLDQSRAQFEAGRSQYESSLGEFEENERILNNSREEYLSGLEELNRGEETLNRELRNGKIRLEDARVDLLEGEREYNTGLADIRQGKLDYEDGLREYNEGLEEYQEGLEEFNAEEADALVEITDGEAEISDAREELSKLREPTFLIEGRNGNSTYYTINGFPGSLKILAIVFSTLALLISMLVAFTTMTRMVDERRVLIGTYKGLGYENSQIALKYVLFGGVSGLTGTLIGNLIGQRILSPIIYEIYMDGLLFSDPLKITSNTLLIIGIILTLITTTLSAFLAVNKTLKSNAAALLRPKAPKVGTRILLEKVDFIWNKLSFMDKITSRNIFRYKGRMFMTIIGVAVCMALMILGFGMKYSVSNVGDLQFGELQRFDLIVAMQQDLEDEDLDEAINEIESNPEVINKNYIDLQTLKLQIPNENTQNVSLFVDMDDNMNSIINFRDRTSNSEITLNGDGVILSEKLANLLNVDVGSTFIVEIDNQEVEVEVLNITENYLGHYIYMSSEYYEEVVGEAPQINGALVSLESKDEESVNNISEELLENDNIVSTISSRDTEKIMSTTVDSIDLVIIIIVLISMLLALVVLYNLTNINVSERIRELSTMKVLGFYPRELTEYVYKETFFLSFIGIIFGMILGKIIVDFVIDVFAPLNIMFGDPRYPLAFSISIFFTILFTLIVMVLMHKRLRKIDMVEALKSID